MTNQPKRPPFIVAAPSVQETRHRYPNSDEYTGSARAIGKAAGLLKIGVNLVRLAPGERSSWPHAEEKEEEAKELPFPTQPRVEPPRHPPEPH